MKRDDVTGCVLGAFMFVLLVLGVAAISAQITTDYHDSVWEAECVRRGVAEYDTKTGAWKWSVEPVESEERR